MKSIVFLLAIFLFASLNNVWSQISEDFCPWLASSPTTDNMHIRNWWHELEVVGEDANHGQENANNGQSNDHGLSIFITASTSQFARSVRAPE